ncbi:sensory protein TspO [Mycobacterium antarcticum]|uniref:TspO/MBR family protein n=1 Tax=Mycolicibacterium sp. TUM20983 TaxID=3023369 RepID=UPI00239376C9|nr:TspO/MBR family protein [Mycolicibacterium sp. TUM20983]GLP75892.1 sensory protein TspO [Mycolicibacterium sp. TUM20983]
MTDVRTKESRRYRWWHAAAVGVVANIASALPAGYNGDGDFYASLRTPPGAPPGWVFAPVWAANNTLTLVSNLRIANLPEETPGRRRALEVEAANWVLFSSFAGMFFGLRSPILAAANTMAGFALTTYSVRATAALDRRAAWALVPRLAWLGFASYVSTSIAVKSPDRLFGYRPGRSDRV